MSSVGASSGTSHLMTIVRLYRNEASKTYGWSHVVAWFSLLDQCRNVDHDDDEEEAHENRAADEKCDMAFAVCGLRC